MRRKETIQMQKNEKMEICTQGYLHGVLHRGSYQENDVSHVSTIIRLSHTHVTKMVFAMQGMAFTILYFALQLEMDFTWSSIQPLFSYFISHEPIRFHLTF